MADDLLIPGGVVSLSGAAAERLLSADDGDAALLYLWRLRRGPASAPDWAAKRLAEAADRLASLGLAASGAAPAPPVPVAERDEPPDYTSDDISRELQNNTSFAPLVKEVERRLGKLLSTTDLKALYTIYDYLALPAEVILPLVTWCVEREEQKYGPGRRPRMAQIRREAFAWRRLGIETAGAADDHIKKMSTLTSREAALLALVGISGRPAVTAERNYFSGWIDMGFEEEAIALAYERTVLKKQSMNWAYMNSILKSWHEKGLHTPAEIAAGDSAYRRSPQAAPPSPQAADARAREDIRWMRDFLAQEKAKEKGGP